MDYEKAYKEALNWMRGIYPTLTGSDKEDAEHYFPELAESEDERTRKWILEYLYDGLRKADEQFKDHFKSAIDWFEKQKEQKIAEWRDRLKDEIKHLKINVYDQSHQFDLGARSSLTFLESFIDSLQQEQMTTL